MENESEREEYVLNDRGRIWIGTMNDYEGLPWNFGQVTEQQCIKRETFTGKLTYFGVYACVCVCVCVFAHGTNILIHVHAFSYISIMFILMHFLC